MLAALPQALGCLLSAACAAGQLRELSLDVENLQVGGRLQPGASHLLAVAAWALLLTSWHHCKGHC